MKNLESESKEKVCGSPVGKSPETTTPLQEEFDQAWNQFRTTGTLPDGISEKTKELVEVAEGVRATLEKVLPPDPSQKAAARERLLNAAKKIKGTNRCRPRKKVA